MTNNTKRSLIRFVMGLILFATGVALTVWLIPETTAKERIVAWVSLALCVGGLRSVLGLQPHKFTIESQTLLGTVADLSCTCGWRAEDVKASETNLYILRHKSESAL